MKFSKENCLKYYQWGENCDGWVFIENPELSIKQEKMPSGTSEQLHFHKKANQVFYILEGEATFMIEGKIIKIQTGEGLEIKAGQKHQIINETNDALEFILFSNPSTKGDRYHIDEN